MNIFYLISHIFRIFCFLNFKAVFWQKSEEIMLCRNLEALYQISSLCIYVNTRNLNSGKEG